MASRTLDVKINASDNASATFAKVSDSAETMGQALEQAGEGGAKSIADLKSELTDVGGVLAGFGAGITAAMALSVNSVNQLESAMANVQSIARVSEAELASLTGQVRDLAVELGTSPTGLADGLYDITSSGFDAAEGMEILEASAIAARAGLTDTATAAKAVTAVLNAYGLEASAAGDVSDVLFKTVDSGVITFEELAGSMGRVLPLASTLSIGIEELGAAYAEMTLQGINASEAETGLSAILTAAINPTTALSEAVREYGYASAEALIQAEGLSGFLEFLDQTANGSAAAMSELTGNVRATNAALILAADGAEGYNSALADMEAAAQGGAYTEEVLALQMDTTAAAMDRARAAIGDLALTAGGTLSPAIRTAADASSGLAIGIGALPGPFQSAASAALALVGGASLLGGALLVLAPRIAATRTALATLGGVRGTIGLLARSFGPVGIAITGVTVAAGYLISRYGEQQRAAEELIATNDALNESLVDLRLNGMDTTEMEAYASALRDIQDMPAPEIDPYPTWLKANADRIESEKINVDELRVEWEQLFDTVNTQYDVSSAEYTAGLDTYIRALTDARINTDAFLEHVDELIAKMTEDPSDAFGPDWFFNELANLDLSQFRGELEETAAASDNWIADMASNIIEGSGELAEAQTQINENFVENTVDLIDQILERQRELMEMGSALAGFDTPLAQAAMSGLAGDAGLLAQNLTVAGQAADNVFRIIVGNTDAIKSQADQTLAWADGLIAVRGEWSRLDELVQQGLITGESGVFDVDTQYAAAQDAYDSLAISTETIKNNLDAVQAIQAPLIAEAQEGVAAWTEELLNMDAAQQRVTLGWYDATTAQQALDAQMLATAVSAGELGANGEQAFEGFIRGAVAANPILFDLLESMELVSGTPMDFEVTLDGAEEAQSEIGLLTETIETLNSILAEAFGIDIDVSGGDEANQVVNDIVDAVTGLDGTSATVNVDVTVAGAGATAAGGLTSLVDQLNIPETIDVSITTTGLEDVEAAQDAIEGLEDTTVTVALGTTGLADVEAAAEAIAGLEGTDIAVTIVADDSDAQDAAAYWAGYNGITFATATVAIVADESDLTTAIAHWSGAAGGGGDAGGGHIGTRSVAIVADTSGIDSALLAYGIGGGGGSGGAAGFDAPTVYVDVAVGSNALDDVLSDDTSHTVTVDVEANMTSLAASLATIGLAGAAMPSVEIAITGNAGGPDGALTVIDNVLLGGKSPRTVEITVGTSGTEAAVSALDGVTSAAGAIPESESVTVVALAEGATSALQGVTAAAGDIPESESVTVNVYGAASAVSALNSVANAAANIPSSVSTTITTNRVTNNVQTFSTQGSRSPFAHGGMVGLPQFAGGGMVPFWAGENGPEIAHFAGGGTALLPYEGLYAAPPMTYISPANAVSNDYSGDTTIIINHYGGGVEEFDRMVETRLLPELERANRQYMHSMGAS